MTIDAFWHLVPPDEQDKIFAANARQVLCLEV
jgi:hypothetical protein